MNRDYDDVITAHYRSVAEADGLAPTSTMADEIIRETETRAIIDFARASGAARILDVGCGNGYTLERLSHEFPLLQLAGVEKSADLRALAARRFPTGAVPVREGDVRDGATLPRGFDAVVCQRVLINLLDRGDQHDALNNIVATTADGAALLFIEAFASSLDCLNGARAEFDLPAIPPAHHNLYLDDDFFTHPDLIPFESTTWTWPDNFLSTHYFVSRVLHPTVLGNRGLIRNSEFVRFFSRALPPAIGDYGPLQLRAFRKVSHRG